MKKTLLIASVCVLALAGCSLFKEEKPKPLTIDLSEAAKDLPIDKDYIPPVKINIPQPDSNGEFTNPEDFRIDKIMNMPIPGLDEVKAE